MQREVMSSHGVAIGGRNGIGRHEIAKVYHARKHARTRHHRAMAPATTARTTDPSPTLSVAAPLLPPLPPPPLLTTADATTPPALTTWVPSPVTEAAMVVPRLMAVAVVLVASDDVAVALEDEEDVCEVPASDDTLGDCVASLSVMLTVVSSPIDVT